MRDYKGISYTQTHTDVLTYLHTYTHLKKKAIKVKREWKKDTEMTSEGRWAGAVMGDTSMLPKLTKLVL